MTQPSPLSLENYRENYNRLPDDVDERFAMLLLRENYKDTIHKALSIIDSYEAAEFLGICLLHRHFLAEPGTVFLERRFTPDNAGHPTTLVTAPATQDTLPAQVAPHRFRIDGEGNIQQLEFTTDGLANEAWQHLRGNRELLRAVGRQLAEDRCSDLLGVGIYSRESDVAAATRVYIEETDFERKRSVVHVLPDLARVPGRLIPTIWTYTPAIGGGGPPKGCCTLLCVLYCEGHPPRPVGVGGRAIGGGFGGYCGHRKGDHIGCV